MTATRNNPAYDEFLDIIEVHLLNLDIVINRDPFSNLHWVKNTPVKSTQSASELLTPA